MNKQQRLNKLFAIALALALLVSCVATLVACNDDKAQTGTITVSFDFNDGITQPVQKTFESKEDVDFTPFEREGYDFVKWTLDKDGSQEYVKGNIQSGATLYAQWKIKTFAVYFFVSDIDTPVYVQTVEYGKAANAPSDETIAENLAAGYVFLSWSESFDCVKSELYVYAVTAKANYTVTFKNGDEVISEVQGKYGQLVDVPDGNALTAPFGYEFDGWQDADGNVATNGQTVFKADTVYSAHWVLTSPSMPTVKGNLNLAYGQSVNLGADVDNKIDGVDYTYEWYISGKKVADGKDVSINNLACGTYYIRCSAYATKGEDKSYPANKTVTVFVQKATLYATISTINIKYGDLLPSYAFEYSGFVYDDDKQVVDIANVAVNTAYEQFSPVGEYNVDASGFVSTNYNVVFTTGKIIVGKKEASEKSPLAFGKEYDGQTLSQTFATDSFDGISEGHVLSLVLTTDSSVVGKYDYASGNIKSVLKISDADGKNVTNNYSVSFSALATISLATIDESDYIVPSAEENTFVYDAHMHGESIKSDEFYVTYSSSQDGEYTSAQLHFVNAGVYTVYYKVSHENYLPVYGSYIVTIEKAKLDVNITNQSTVYGAQFEFDQTLFVVRGNDYHALTYAISCAYKEGDNAGTYPIELKIDSTDKNALNNFDITVNSALLTVEKAPLSVVLNPVWVTYGDVLDLGGQPLTTSGLYRADNLSNVVVLTTDYAADNAHGINGEYYIYCSLKEDNQNYVLTSEKAKVTVEKRILRVQIDDMSVVYGEPLGEYTYSVAEGSLVDGDVLSDVIICESDYKCGINNYTPVGFTDINAKSGNDNYVVYAVPATVEIQKRPVTVTPSPNGIAYNLSLADWLGGYKSIEIQAETQWGVSGRGFIGSDYGKGTKIDAYSFRLVRGHFGENAQEEYLPGMIGGFELVGQLNDENLEANYDVTVATVNTSVSALNYSIKINKKFAYKNGVAAAFDIASAMNAGLREGDTVQGTVSTKSGEVGIYQLDWHNYTEFDDMFVINGFKVTNEYGDVTSAYSLNKVNCDINIEIAEISIPHNVQSQYEFTYDGEEHIVGVEVDDDSVEVTYSIDGGAWTSDVPSFMNVKDDLTAYTVNYKLVKYDESVAEPIEYTGSYTVKMNWRNIQVICHDQYATYGEDYTLDQTAYEFSGVLEKDKSSISVTLYVNNYKVGDCIGTYYINANTNAPRNYNCHTTAGEFHVQQKQVYVRGTQDYTVIYGEEAPEYTAYEVVDESGNIVDGAKEFIKLVNIYTPGCAAGMVYGVDTEVLLDRYFRNYKVMGCSISIEVLPRQITVKTKDASFVYGQQIALEYEIVDGTLFAGDTLDAAFDLTETHVGEYAVTPSFDSYNASNKNYAVTAQSGVVTITKATLTVALSKTQTITYGDDMPTYTATISGFVNGDDKSVLGGELIVSCDYSANKAAGTFDVTASGLTSNDYEFVYEKSSLVVKKATLTLTAKPHAAITYGDDVPTDFEYVAEGFVNGDDKSLLSDKVSFSTLYFKGANASATKYTFNIACSELENYTVNIGSAQTLVVNKADYTKAHVEEALAAITLTGTYKYGQTLGAYSLRDTGFDWTNHNELVTCDLNERGYLANYCKDKVNYNVFDDGATYIKINLSKAAASFEFDGDFGTKWTGSPIDFQSIISGKSCPDGTVTANLISDVDGWNPTFSYSVTEPVGVTQMIDGGIYKVRVSASETANYNAAYVDVTFNVYAAQLGNVYMTVENALEKAKSGDTVYLVGNAFLSKNTTVKDGVTLVLGLKTANYTRTLGKVDTSAEYAISGLDDYAWKTLAPDYTLTIQSGATLTLANGNVLVAGLLGHASTHFEGHTSGAYSKIANNGTIVVNGGIFDIRGLVAGSGNIVFNGGNVYCPFVVRDFKGGDYTVNKCWDLLSSTKVAPFSEYEMPNIQCTSRYYSGATLSGYADLYANRQHNITTIKAISANGILRIADGGYVEKSYDSATGVTTLTLVGNVTLGSLELKVTYLLMSKTVKMSDTYFPVPWTYNVNIGNGTDATSVTAPHDYKIMPSGKITVNANAKLTTTGNVIVYSNFVDQKVDKVNGLIYPQDKGKAGFFVLNGGELEASAFGGVISVTQAGGKVKINKNTSVTAYEHSYDDRFSFAEEARLENGTKLEKGTLYTL